MTQNDRIHLAGTSDLELAKLAAKMGLKTNGRAAYMKMLFAVQNGDVPAITGTPKQVIRKVITARKKADQYSSWGWLSARAGMNEGTLKKAVAEAGYPVFGDRVATTRAAKNAKKNGKVKKAA